MYISSPFGKNVTYLRACNLNCHMRLVGPGDRDDLERNPKKEWGGGDRKGRRGKWPKKSREEGEIATKT